MQGLAAITVLQLARYDIAVAGGNAALIRSSRKDALANLRKRVYCNPRDGEASMQLAFLQLADEGASPEVIGLLVHSQHLSPLEGDVLRRRLPRLAMMAASGISAAGSLLARDIATAGELGEVELIEETLKLVPAGTRPFFARIAERAANRKRGSD